MHWTDAHCAPEGWRPWVPEARERPRSRRRNDATTQYVMEPLPRGAVVDPRTARDIFGAPTRSDARESCIVRPR
jgi:hypothetical protein